MRYEKTITIDEAKVNDLQSILDIEEGYYEGARRTHTFETFTAAFEDGIEVDIKVCNGDTPFVDAVIFEYGSEIGCLEVSDTLLGEYQFDLENAQYVVNVVSA